MDRREALSRVALIFGGTIIGAEAFLSGCKTTPKKEGLFADADIALLDEVGDTILPTTAASPGAKAAQIGQFMKTIVTDGAFMVSSACQNPSLTYMAMTARAANHAVEELKKGNI